MPVNKRKKFSRMRGSHTHGGGAKKKRRGAGNRGGRGMAGSGKRADQKKPTILKLYGNSYFGKKGFTARRNKKQIKAINIQTIEDKLYNWLKKGILKKEGDTIKINLKEMGYNKLLGSGRTKNLPFKKKLKWTLIVLVSFFILGVIPLWGLGKNSLEQFDFLSIILAAQFGSLISLGIGPIVTASIVLQLLNGSGILKIDTNNHEGRVLFQGLQKILTIFFIIFEAIVYIFMGGLSPAAGISPWILVFQLFLGGMLILYMDEVMNKWGFGSGVSLFIAAGVSAEIIIKAFSPLTTTGAIAFGTGQAPIGKVFVFFYSLVQGNPTESILAASAIAFTILVFVISVYAQAMKVEIPLSFGRVRGYGIRWPLRFMYTSNIPVILVAALMANVQLWARLLENWGYPF